MALKGGKIEPKGSQLEFGDLVMTHASFVPADIIRSMFSAAMTQMYRVEVPQYRTMARIVAEVDGQALAGDSTLEGHLKRAGRFDLLGVERHGAIRVGTPTELYGVRRLFAVMGMTPVGYYDLSPAGMPVHSTAFRPTDEESLRRCPFRIFTSLLRPELIADAGLRREAGAILARRKIFTPHCLRLIDAFEENGGLDEAQAIEFVAQALETFRWRGEATVSASVYEAFRKAHPLIADVVCFDGPHINHLTLPSLDIDSVQRAMAAHDLNPKTIVEGPPRRHCPILLRQTSFKAIEEPIVFSDERGAHAARFGEIEQRGGALTAKGRALYDRLLASVNAAVPVASDGSNVAAYMDELARQFAAFPDDEATLRARGLAFFRYAARPGAAPHEEGIEGLLRAGLLRSEPVLYEDFLPVSAAGIFQSNLGEGGRQKLDAQANRAAFEAALGAAVADEMELYAQAEERSLSAALEELRKASVST